MAKSPSSRGRNKTPVAVRAGAKPKSPKSAKKSPEKKSPSKSPSKKGSPKAKKERSGSSSPKRERSSSRSPRGSVKDSSPKGGKASARSISPPKHVVAKKAVKGDVMDNLIDKLTVPGMFAGIIGLIAVGIQLFGYPDQMNLHICAFVLGMGRGGVPGCATVAAALFVLLAPDGYVKEVSRASRAGWICEGGKLS